MGIKPAIVCGIVVGVVLAVSGCDPVVSPTDYASPSTVARAPYPAAPDTAAPTVPQPAATPAVTGDTETVTRVVDGDTFEVAGGRTIRVLGIDSCEASTDGGRRATSAAVSALAGQQVRLASEPGVDRDRYDRELRYVATDVGDFGETMVGADHTAVYAGRNDASETYQQELRSLDSNDRTCDDPTPPAGSSSGSDDDSTYVPTPDASTSSGSSSSASGSSGVAFYKNCAAARAAGAAPLHVGDPGYSGKLDRDGDGVACE